MRTSFRWITAVTSLAFVVAQLDVSIVNIALPGIAKTFKAGMYRHPPCHLPQCTCGDRLHIGVDAADLSETKSTALNPAHHLFPVGIAPVRQFPDYRSYRKTIFRNHIVDRHWFAGNHLPADQAIQFQ